MGLFNQVVRGVTVSARGQFRVTEEVAVAQVLGSYLAENRIDHEEWGNVSLYHEQSLPPPTVHGHARLVHAKENAPTVWPPRPGLTPQTGQVAPARPEGAAWRAAPSQGASNRATHQACHTGRQRGL